MTNGEIADQVRGYCGLLSDGHAECISAAVDATTFLNKGYPQMAANALKAAIRRLEAQTRRCDNLASEFKDLLEEIG